MPPVKKKRHLSKSSKVIIAIVLVLIIFRLFLPSIVLHYANKALANISGYYGHIEDIDISLYRGAYELNNMYLNKVDTKMGRQTDFFRTRNVDLSIEWRALFHGKLVGEIVFASPKLIFTKNKTEISDIKKDTNDFRKILKDFMPLKVNRLEVHDGSVHYVDNTTKPKVDISVQQVYMLAQNLRNVRKEKTLLPSPVTAHGTAYGGTVTLDMKINVLAERSTFDLNAEVKNSSLVKLNNFLKAYGNFDVNKGTFGLYTEFAAKGGKYDGYIKPVIKDLDVLGPEDKKDGFFHKVYEGLVGTAGNILENPKKEQIATKIPIHGEFGKSDTNTLEAIWELLKNAFIRALVPAVDNQININSVGKDEKEHKSLLQKIFPGHKKKDDKKKNNK